ncbi:MAG: tetratricopeptide repeat protein, partial [Stellaceae bacterium]
AVPASGAERWQDAEAAANAQLKQGNYQDAIASYRHAIDIAPKGASRTAIANMHVGIGNAYLKLRKNDDAVAEFAKAAAIDPHLAVASFSLCAVLYNLGRTGPKAVSACDRAIAADPKKADAYFIKGSMLFGEAKIGANKKLVVPPAAIAALKKYLVVAPDGPHAADVKQMLSALK